MINVFEICTQERTTDWTQSIHILLTAVDLGAFAFVFQVAEYHKWCQ